MDKNIQKYESYKNAYDQIKAAIGAGFYLEAITIEESILADRLYRFCKDRGYSRRAERATLGNEKRYLEGLSVDIQQSEEIDFLVELDLFWTNRNKCLHQIVKSEPGEPTIDVNTFKELARQTASDGLVLVKKVNSWVKRYIQNTKC
ncbi:MAG: hypothetical protein AB9897_05885 [Anaerolineaceae bacterium]